jgi:hypothetical protein
MMSALALLVANGMTLPVPVMLDLQRAAPYSQEFRRLSVRLFVSPAGTVLDCRIIRSEFDPGRSRKACEKLSRTRMERVAVGPDGEPSYGELELMLVRGVMRGQRPKPGLNAPDFEFIVKAQPHNTTEKARIGVAILVGTQGEVAACDPGNSSPDLGTFACENIRAFRGEVRVGNDGQPVPYVRALSIQFIEGNTQPAG